MVTILVTTAGTFNNNSNDTAAKKIEQNNQFFRAWGSAYTTLYNQSSNYVNKVVVDDVLGTRTFLNPTFPLYFGANGNVTVICYFNHTGVDGVITASKLTSSGWVVTDSENYNTNYLTPVTYSTVGPETDQVIIN
jgi:hypothetical protein